MQATNPSSRPVHSRLYQLTPVGSRLARYLDYVEKRPAFSQDIHFGEIGDPPEQFDDDRQPLDESKLAHPRLDKIELDRLYAELERCQEEMFRPNCPNWRYDELLRDVREIREEIAGIEGE